MRRIIPLLIALALLSGATAVTAGAGPEPGLETKAGHRRDGADV